MNSIYALSDEYCFYNPSDKVGVVLFSVYSNNLYHLPEIPAQYFYELSQSGITLEKFTDLCSNTVADVNEAFKDMINKGILVLVK